jgi:hypothetical protein
MMKLCDTASLHFCNGIDVREVIVRKSHRAAAGAPGATAHWCKGCRQLMNGAFRYPPPKGEGIPIGEQLMALPASKRRCPMCLGELSYDRGCGRRKVPCCLPCNGSFPLGSAGLGHTLTVDSETGVVNGWF